jgi:hypothetical protein
VRRYGSSGDVVDNQGSLAPPINRNGDSKTSTQTNKKEQKGKRILDNSTHGWRHHHYFGRLGFDGMVASRLTEEVTALTETGLYGVVLFLQNVHSTLILRNN